MANQNEPTIGTRLSWRERFSFGLGDLGFNFYWGNISAFLMIFYTDVFGISAAAAGTMLFAIKIVNAFQDPVIGAVADRTRTRFGKFRPYLIWMALPLALAAVLTYTTPPLSPGAKLIWAYATYFCLMLFYTGTNIPYNGLSGVITSDAQERVTLNSMRFVCGFAGSTIVTAATLKLVQALGHGNSRLGWQLTIAFWGVAASLILLVTFANTRERIAPSPKQETNLVRDVKDLAQNGPWLVLFFLALIIMLTITFRTAAAAYYFKYYVERPNLVGAFLPAYMAAAAVGAWLTQYLTRLLDKKVLLILLMSVTGVLSCAFFFIPKDQIVLMFVLQVVIGLVLGPKSPLAFSMYADTADYNEWKTGRRATALTFAAATFSQKLGTALTAVGMGAIFTAVGYVANAPQSAKSQMGILLMMSFAPALFAFVAVAVTCFYRLDGKMMARIQSELAARKAAENAGVPSPV